MRFWAIVLAKSVLAFGRLTFSAFGRPYKDYRGASVRGEDAYLFSLPKTTPIGLTVYPYELEYVFIPSTPQKGTS